MAAPELGRWEPLSVEATVATFGEAPFRWWIGGGHALELHVGRSWRAHDDTDVGVTRADVTALRTLLDGWDLHIAAAGRLVPWAGGPLQDTLQQNNLWCRRRSDGPWVLDVTIGDGTADEWIYRRDHRIRVVWPDAVLRTPDGIPYLAPDLQLLFKSRTPRSKDHVDATEVAPTLDPARTARLAALLPDDHPWQALLDRSR